MKITLVGSRYFGGAVFDALRADGADIARVVAPAADDRLAKAADAAGVPLFVHPNPKLIPGEAIAEGTGLVIAAHTHARVSDEALARASIGGVGYHPSLLPRHRGIAAVEWTILEADPIAGGSVYHLADGWDAGPIAAQDWCFVAPGETARELWERALAPMGLELLKRVARHARDTGTLPAFRQDERFATRAPMIRRSVTLAEAPRSMVSIVVTAIGADRPGIVKLLSERAQGFGANWAGSRMTHMSGQFAGMVHLQVPEQTVAALTAALRELEQQGLRVTIARSDAPSPSTGRRMLKLDLVAPDRPGIVRDLSARLSESGVSIEDLHTELVGNGAAAAGGHTFRITALLVVPDALATDTLRRELEVLAHELMVDIALGDHAPRPVG